MKKNIATPNKMSVVAKSSMQLAAVLMLAFLVAILNILGSVNCSQLMKSVGEKKNLLSRLEDEYSRESARWEEMKTPEKLEVALRRHGLSMKYAKPSQIVRMKSDGRVVPGQISVAKAAQRNKAAQTAKY